MSLRAQQSEVRRYDLLHLLTSPFPRQAGAVLAQKRIGLLIQAAVRELEARDFNRLERFSFAGTALLPEAPPNVHEAEGAILRQGVAVGARAPEGFYL